MELPREDALRWIVGAYAHLRASHGGVIGAPELVQPTGEYFPDPFHPDGPSLVALLRRMMSYAPLAEDIGIELAVVEGPSTQREGGGGCGSLACGSGGYGAVAAGRRSGAVEELADGYRVRLVADDIGHPDVLVASLARAVGVLVLHEANEHAAHGSRLSAAGEVAAAACGLGVLLTSGAAVWAKSCGGLRMAQATLLSVEESAVALALFLALHERKPSIARAHLGATQREALDRAVEWVDSNQALVEALRDRPALLEAGVFEIEPVRGALARWLLGRKREKLGRSPPEREPSPLPMSDERRRRLEEARALVDEVLGGP